MELKETDLYKFGTTEMDKFKIIQAIVGGEISKNHLDEYTFHNGQSMPSDDEINTKFAELTAEYDTLQYQRDREPDYPNLAEQFDLLWHAIDADTLDKTSDFYTTLKAVKDAHPKG